MQKTDDYLSFKLALVEKTFDLYVQRMDIWEDQFYKIKYGCISVVVALLGFRYTLPTSSPFLNYLALAATIGLWLFESTLRTTFFRYIAKLDLITEIINNIVVIIFSHYCAIFDRHTSNAQYAISYFANIAGLTDITSLSCRDNIRTITF